MQSLALENGSSTEAVGKAFKEAGTNILEVFYPMDNKNVILGLMYNTKHNYRHAVESKALIDGTYNASSDYINEIKEIFKYDTEIIKSRA